MTALRIIVWTDVKPTAYVLGSFAVRQHPASFRGLTARCRTPSRLPVDIRANVITTAMLDRHRRNDHRFGGASFRAGYEQRFEIDT
jgi:hypothetical protein